MSRTRSRALGAAPDQAGHLFGVPTSLLALGVLAAAGYAYFSSGAESTDAPAASAQLPSSTTAAKLPTVPGNPTTKPVLTHSTPTSGTSPSQVKPYRRALVAAGSPLLYVFVNSLGGEGIFDRLKNASSLLDGNGLNRVATLDNGEFAGFATGNEWIAPDTLNVYTQVYQVINRIGYNYWIQKSETQQVHAAAAVAGMGQALNLKNMSAEHQSQVQVFYFNNYTF